MSTTATIKTRFQSARPNRTDVEISVDRWNDSRVIAGGATGGIMLRDTAKTDGWGLLDAVAVGQVLVSGGTSTEPAYSAAPSLTSVALTSFVSVGSNVASAGAVRLSNNVAVSWRNAANNANFSITLNGSNVFAFDAPATIAGTVTISTGNLVIGSGSIYIPNAGFISTASWGDFSFSADGRILARNGAGTGFDRFQLGGTTSSFPSLKRVAATLEARLADDSAQARLLALGISLGTNPATGVDPINLPNEGRVVSRNGANSGNLTVARVNSSNAVVLGDTNTTGISWEMASMVGPDQIDSSFTSQRAAGTVLSQSPQTVADTAIISLGTGIGFYFVVDVSTGNSAIFTAVSGNVFEVYDSAGNFSPTKGTAACTNVYWDAGNARYELENLRGASRNYRIVKIGVPS